MSTSRKFLLETPQFTDMHDLLCEQIGILHMGSVLSSNFELHLLSDLVCTVELQVLLFGGRAYPFCCYKLSNEYIRADLTAHAMVMTHIITIQFGM